MHFHFFLLHIFCWVCIGAWKHTGSCVHMYKPQDWCTVYFLIVLYLIYWDRSSHWADSAQSLQYLLVWLSQLALKSISASLCWNYRQAATHTQTLCRLGNPNFELESSRISTLCADPFLQPLFSLKKKLKILLFFLRLGMSWSILFF